MAKIVIFGDQLNAQLAHHYFKTDSPHVPVAFAVDKAYRSKDSLEGLPVVDFESVTSIYPPSEYQMFIAIGYSDMNKLRAAKYQEARKKGYQLVNYVSSRCSFLTQEKIGDNCFILEDNTVQPFVRIGNNVILWSGNHIGHHSTIGDHCFISSHVVVSGNSKVGPYCFIGVNATLRDAITVAPATLIGAGCAIMEDTAEKSVYVSRPAKKIEKTSDEINL